MCNFNAELKMLHMAAWFTCLLLVLPVSLAVTSCFHPFPLPSTHPKEEEEEEEAVKGPVADEPKPAVALGEELEKISGPAEPLHQAGDSSEAQQEPVPEDKVARNGESVTIVHEEPSQAKMPPLGEEGVSSLGTCMDWLPMSCSQAFSTLLHLLFFLSIILIINALIIMLEECIAGKPIVQML